MSGVDDGGIGITLWQNIASVGAFTLTFFSGVWAAALAQGQLKRTVSDHDRRLESQQRTIEMLQGNQTSGLERLKNNGERILRLENGHEEVREKLGAMAEKMAQLPTRSEMNEGFSRIEAVTRNAVQHGRTH